MTCSLNSYPADRVLLVLLLVVIKTELCPPAATLLREDFHLLLILKAISIYTAPFMRRHPEALCKSRQGLRGEITSSRWSTDPSGDEQHPGNSCCSGDQRAQPKRSRGEANRPDAGSVEANRRDPDPKHKAAEELQPFGDPASGTEPSGFAAAHAGAQRQRRPPDPPRDSPGRRGIGEG